MLKFLKIYTFVVENSFRILIQIKDKYHE